ncbi:MAG: hypothetical protein EOO73_34790 [Myxococcales bacterium]|nr:MAG: hypothetical protein EOO73_34790 [Myxococcales bacterium]
MSAELDGNELVARMRAELDDELWALAERLFVADYSFVTNDAAGVKERAIAAAFAAEVFLDLRDAQIREATRREEARARRAAKRASKAVAT